MFEMDPSFFEQAALELEADAKDFLRAVDTQLSVFVREKELHERTIQELNRSLLPVEITTRKDKRAQGAIGQTQREAAHEGRQFADKHRGD